MTSDTVMTMPVSPAYGGGGMFGNGFGGDGWWIILLFLLWGRNGWGNDGTNSGVGSEVQRGFDHSATVTKLDGITTGIADATYALNNGLTNGFHGVDSAICNLGYQTQSGFNALAAQLAQCCCDNREAIAGVRYDLATQACETRHAIQDSTRQILDFLTADKINTLTAENQSLKFAASQSAQNAFITANQEAQTAELVRRINPTPVPAYTVPAPYPYGYGYGCGYNACA